MFLKGCVAPVDFSGIRFLCCFLPVFLTVYYICPARYRNGILFAGSLVFVGAGGCRNAVLPVCLVTVNFVLGRRMQGGTIWRARTGLALALACNFLLLGYYKFMAPALPTGISYYTFALISYDLDIFYRRVKTPGGWLELGTFTMMFPKFPAGPIAKYRDLAGPLHGRRVRMRRVEYGLSLAIVGLAFKVLLADRLGTCWHAIQTAGFESISTPMAWLGLAGYCVQLLYDFQGYSLMARGLAAMLGFELPRNFEHPYKAQSVSEYYRRWHMSLGKWFRDYLYIPLGGNRCGTARMCVNLMIVWMATGIWHGITANFLLWGTMLGLLIVTEKLWTEDFLKRHRLFAHCYVWFLIPLTWAIFAIPDGKSLGIYFGRLFPFVGKSVLGQGTAGGGRDWINAVTTYFPFFLTAFAVSGKAAEYLWKKYWDKVIVKAGLFAVFWICIYTIGQEAQNPFLYLNF